MFLKNSFPQSYAQSPALSRRQYAWQSESWLESATVPAVASSSGKKALGKQ